TMAKLYGAQRMVLQAIADIQRNSGAYIEDTRLAGATKIALADVRDWLETLASDDYINLARTQDGLSASIEAKGRLELGLHAPFDEPRNRPFRRDKKVRRVFSDPIVHYVNICILFVLLPYAGAYEDLRLVRLVRETQNSRISYPVKFKNIVFASEDDMSIY